MAIEEENQNEPIDITHSASSVHQTRGNFKKRNQGRTQLFSHTGLA